MHTLMIQGKRIDLFPGEALDCPMIYLHTAGSEGAAVWQALREMRSPDFSLVAVSQLNWNDEMSPWASASIRKNDVAFGGGADAYLATFLTEIVPQVEAVLPAAPRWRGLCGYSLAGLFSIYALYKSALFSRIASVSGSLWYPGLQDFIESHAPCVQPECLYFSLGDKECRTRNLQLRTVQTATERIVAYFKQQGISTAFVLNSGNHFNDVAMRTARAVDWLLTAGA